MSDVLSLYVGCPVPESKRSISCFMPLTGIDAGPDHSTTLCVSPEEGAGSGGKGLSAATLCWYRLVPKRGKEEVLLVC